MKNIKQPKPSAFKPLDNEEKELMNLIESGVMVKDAKSDEIITKIHQLAVNTMKEKKEARVSIRITYNDLTNIKNKASDAGIPYQTIMASVLHKYAKGEIKVAI